MGVQGPSESVDDAAAVCVLRRFTALFTANDTVFPWVQRPAVVRPRPVSGPMSCWGAGGGVGGGWSAANLAL